MSHHHGHPSTQPFYNAAYKARQDVTSIHSRNYNHMIRDFPLSMELLRLSFFITLVIFPRELHNMFEAHVLYLRLNYSNESLIP